jgi:serine protease Do
MLAWPAQAFAAIPSGQTADPLERGVLLALGSVYRVETTVSVQALRTHSGRLFPLGTHDDVTELGTAFAVAPNGVLVTEAHVASPSGVPLAIAAAPLALAQKGIVEDKAASEEWVATNAALPVDVHVLRVRVWRATANSNAHATEFAAQLKPGSLDEHDDLALLLIPDHHIPALVLSGSEPIGTPVAAIGYGVATPTLGLPTTAVPGIKTGSLGPTGHISGVTGEAAVLNGQQLTQIDAPIARGDSGGPVVDSTGAVDGIVRFLYKGSSGLADPNGTIKAFLGKLDIDNAAGPIATDFATGMSDLWTTKLTGAHNALQDTVRVDPSHPLAAQELALVAQLPKTPPRAAPTHRLRLLFLGLAALAFFAAMLCVVRLRQITRTGRDSNDATPQFPTAH